MGFFQNTCKPQGAGGFFMLTMMNLGHAMVSRWGCSYLTVPKNSNVLDIGCGGGANLSRLLRLCPQGFVTGIDYSPLSVSKSKRKNREAIANGHCIVLQQNVKNLVYPPEIFHLITAVETVYFWPEPEACFRNIYKILKDEGVFMICNESDGEQSSDEKWMNEITGMSVYRDTQLKSMLENAGFRDIEIHRRKKGWLCVIARKHLSE